MWGESAYKCDAYRQFCLPLLSMGGAGGHCGPQALVLVLEGGELRVSLQCNGSAAQTWDAWLSLRSSSGASSEDVSVGRLPMLIVNEHEQCCQQCCLIPPCIPHLSARCKAELSALAAGARAVLISLTVSSNFSENCTHKRNAVVREHFDQFSLAGKPKSVDCPSPQVSPLSKLWGCFCKQRGMGEVAVHNGFPCFPSRNAKDRSRFCNNGDRHCLRRTWPPVLLRLWIYLKNVRFGGKYCLLSVMHQWGERC